MVSRSDVLAVIEEVLDEHEVDNSSGVAEDLIDRLQSEYPDEFYDDSEDVEDE